MCLICGAVLILQGMISAATFTWESPRGAVPSYAFFGSAIMLLAAIVNLALLKRWSLQTDPQVHTASGRETPPGESQLPPQ